MEAEGDQPRPRETRGSDESWMATAIAEGAKSRRVSPPNPWVGAVLVAQDGAAHRGSTSAPGGPHAEIGALTSAGRAAKGATLYVTLEPCAHHGRTPPCVDSIIASGISKVVIGVIDPDPAVSGRGIQALCEAGVEVSVGVAEAAVSSQLAPYLKHRRSGRPWVVLKMAATLDGRTAAPDGSSKWITGEEARRDAHQLRAESDAVAVGAGTIRADDPELNVRGIPQARQPLRVVFGHAPKEAKAQPLLELNGPLGACLDRLGGQGVLQLLVEGGAKLAHDFHSSGLVDRYVFYLAPALMGGDDAKPLLAGSAVATIGDMWRGEVVSVRLVGGDIRVELANLAANG